MGSKGGSGGGSSSTNFGVSNSTYQPNPEAMAAYRRALSMAENVTSQPYEPYQGQLTAGFTPDQMQGFEATRQMQGMVQPYINSATALQNQALAYSDPRNFNAQTLQQYQNPYQQNVIDATMANLGALNAQNYNQANAQAMAGGPGSSGSYAGRGAVAKQNAMANAQTLAGLQQQGYNQAVQNYTQQQQQAIQTAQGASYGLGQLGSQAQQAALQGIQALLGTGAQQQALQQQQLTGAYNQWLQAKAFPYQQAAFYAGIAGGIAPNMGGTTNTMSFGMGNQQQQQAQGGGGGAGMGMSVLSMLPAMFSDENDKTDIKYLGKDESGEKQYAYRYKGDPKSYPKVVGPMAQDIEEHSPERVKEIGGHKIVEGLGRLAPSERAHFADGGAGSVGAAGAGQGTLGSLGTPQTTGQTAQTTPSIYDVPAADTSQPAGGPANAQSTPGMDPNVASFVQNIFDPKTADQMARAKWVNQPQELGEQQFGGDNYIIPPSLMNDGGQSYPYNPPPGTPKAHGGRTGYDQGGMPGGSFFDLINKTASPYAMPGVQDPGAQALGKLGPGAIMPMGHDVAKEKTAAAAAHGLEQVMKSGSGGGGGGGGSEGGKGLGDMMKGMKGAKGAASGPAAASAEASGAAPAADTGDAAAAAEPVAAADTGAAMPEPAPEAPPMDFAAAAPQIPEIPLIGMFGGMKRGGRVAKDGGGAAGGMGPAGPAGPGPGLSALGQENSGLGDVVLGNAKSPGELAGLGNLMAGQEKLTGTNLLNKLDTLRFAHSAGPQLSPVEQGMPAMPDASFYQTPRTDLPSKLMTEHYGEENPNPVPGFMMMSGMGQKGGMLAPGSMGAMGFASQINQQNQAGDAAAKRAQLSAQRESMLKDPANFPVQGYYTKIASPNLNEATGLFNVDYTGAYRGYPYRDGGRVEKAGGGSIEARKQQAMQFFLNKGYSLSAAAGIVGNLVHESGGKLDPSAAGDPVRGRNTSFGIAQWHGDRIGRLQNFAKANKSNWNDLNTQLAFVDHELRTRYRDTLAKIMSARTPAQAAGHMVVGYENPLHRVTGDPTTYHGYANRVRMANQLAQMPVSVDAVAPVAASRPYQNSLAFNRPATPFPHPSQEPTFTPAPELRSAYAGKTPQERAHMAQEAEAQAAAQRNALAAASRKPGFSLSNFVVSPAAAADRGVYPESITQGPPMPRGSAETRIRNHEHPHTVGELGLTQQPTGDLSFTRQPEWKSKSMGLSPDRMMLGDTTESVTSKDMPMGMDPWGDTGFAEQAPESAPEAPAAAADTTPAAASSGQKYWGDYRDVEQSGIGDLVDELAGDVRTSAKPGTASTPMGAYTGPEGGLGAMFDLAGTLPSDAAAPQAEPAAASDTGLDLGNILGLARGGIARNGYATDGAVEDTDPLSELGSGISSALGGIGEGIGSLFQGSEGSKEQPVAAADTAASPGLGGVGDFFERWSTNPLSQFLFAAGLGTMASDRVNPLQAIGQGGMLGLEYMQAAQAQQRALRKEQAAEQARREQLKLLGGLEDQPAAAGDGEETTAEPAPGVVPSTPPPAPKITETAPAATPETAAPAVPAKPETTAAPDTAAGDRTVTPRLPDIDRLYARHKEITRRLGMATDPQVRAALRAQQQAAQFDIQRAEKKAIPIAPADYGKYGIPKDAQGPWYFNPATGMPVQVGKPGTTITMPPQETEAEKSIGKKMGETITNIYDEGQTAREQSAAVGELEELAKDIPFGSQAGIIDYLGRNFGVNVEGADKVRAFGAIIDKLAPQQRAAGTGAMSDKDLAGFKNSLPSLLNTKEGNAIVVDTMKALSEYKLAKADIAEKVITKQLPMAEGLKQMRALEDPLTRFKEYRKEHKEETSSAPKSGYSDEDRAKAAEILKRRREGKQ